MDCLALVLTIFFASSAVAGETLSARQTLERIGLIDYEIVLKLEARRGRPFDDRELIGVTNSKEFDIEYPKAKAAFCARERNANSLACRDAALIKPADNTAKAD